MAGEPLPDLFHEEDDPPELIELRHERVHASVNPDGAYLDSLSVVGPDGQPVDLLFPHQGVVVDGEPKERGTHICLPVFGPHEGLMQHGFGRDLTWKVHNPSHRPSHQQTTLRLHVTGEETELGARRYAGLVAQLQYEIQDSPDMGPRVIMNLRVANNSEEPFVIAPGFHPYFALPEGTTAEEVEFYNFPDPLGATTKVRYDDETLLAAPTMSNRDGHIVAQLPEDHGGIHFYNTNLPHYVIWTDNADRYLCIEPTSDGALRGIIEDEYYLHPKTSRSYQADISWDGYKKQVPNLAVDPLYRPLPNT